MDKTNDPTAEDRILKVLKTFKRLAYRSEFGTCQAQGGVFACVVFAR